VVSIHQPTAIVLTSFTAAVEGGAISVRWVTAAELNTWGFYLYRSADENRAHAIRITPELILGRGRAQGASYIWIDTDITSDTSYTYWLQEIELNGTVNEYGPARAHTGISETATRLFVPLVLR
jgi:hypothetical protein